MFLKDESHKKKTFSPTFKATLKKVVKYIWFSFSSIYESLQRCRNKRKKRFNKKINVWEKGEFHEDSCLIFLTVSFNFSCSSGLTLRKKEKFPRHRIETRENVLTDGWGLELFFRRENMLKAVYFLHEYCFSINKRSEVEPLKKQFVCLATSLDSKCETWYFIEGNPSKSATNLYIERFYLISHVNFTFKRKSFLVHFFIKLAMFFKRYKILEFLEWETLCRTIKVFSRLFQIITGWPNILKGKRSRFLET